MREVGVPSRTILHGRGVGSKSRIRVTGPPGSSGALWTCKKVKALREHANFGLLRYPLFLGAGMRSVSAFRNVTCFWQKREPVKKSKLFGNMPIMASLESLSFWVRACVLYIGISLFGFRRVSGSESLRIPESQSSRVSESQSLKISESQSLRVSQSQNVTTSESQSLRVSESQSSTVSESQSSTVSESQSSTVPESQSSTVSESQSSRVSERQKAKVRKRPKSRKKTFSAENESGSGEEL